MAVLEIHGVSKSFKKKKVLNEITCDFSNGITALLGPNGAGKSTLINIMSTLLKADAGIVTYDGTDVQQMKEVYLGKLAVQFQNQPMYKNYTAEEYLEFCGALKGMKSEEVSQQSIEFMEYFGLSQYMKKKIATFSGGMKQRLALCGTFLGNPEIVFLDEPSAGLDIYEREELKRLLYQLKKKCIIIISTHIVSDIENIADQIILLSKGEIYSTGTQEKLIGIIDNCIWDVSLAKEEDIKEKVYHSDGKRLCYSKVKPCEDACLKKANLTDVYFSCLQMRDK